MSFSEMGPVIRPEALTTPARPIVLLGSRISRVFTGDGVTDYLGEHDIQTPVIVYRDVETIRGAFDDPLPRGVILFPEMRVAHPIAEATIPTAPHIAGLVKELCDINAVPLRQMRIDPQNSHSPDQQVIEAIREFTF